MKTHSTNYFNTLIEVAEDCPVTTGEQPPVKKNPSIALMQFEMIHRHPYQYTSDDVIFNVFAQRQDLTEKEKEAARNIFYSKGQPCLRCSPLAKRYGWGIHSNEEGKVALYSVDSETYKTLLKDKSLAHVKAMRQSKK